MFFSTYFRNILKKGGKAADAAIAGLFCLGVMNPQSAGLGGGFFMIYYNATSKTSITLNAREVAPMGATEDMFDSDVVPEIPGEMFILLFFQRQ